MTTTDPLTLAREDLDFIRQHLATACRRLEDQRRGQPGSALGGNGGRGGGSPVETALGLSGPGDGDIRGDRAAHLLDQIDLLTKQLCRTAHLLRLIVEAEVPRPPTDKQRRDVERENREQVEECAIMRRLADDFEVTLCTSDLGGLLPEPLPVCRWVYDFARSKGRLPSKQEAKQHALGQRVMVKA